MGMCESKRKDDETVEEVECCEGSSTYPSNSIIQHNQDCKIKASAAERDPLWPDGIVPYEIDHSLDYNIHRILMAMKSIELHSRIRFVLRNGQDKYLEINKSNGCLFHQGNYSQPRVSIGIGCEDFGIVLHELLHALGFPHEQRRPDRDDHIIIHSENIIKGKEPQFSKLSPEEYRWPELPFDYNSIMMYDEYAFSINKKRTIEAKDGRSINRKRELSKMDRIKLSLL